MLLTNSIIKNIFSLQTTLKKLYYTSLKRIINSGAREHRKGHDNNDVTQLTHNVESTLIQCRYYVDRSKRKNRRTAMSFRRTFSMKFRLAKNGRQSDDVILKKEKSMSFIHTLFAQFRWSKNQHRFDILFSI